MPNEHQAVLELPPRPKKPYSFRALWRYLAPYKVMLSGVLISLLMISTAVLMISKVIKMFIDHGISSSSQENLDQALLLLFATISGLALFTFCRFFLINLVGERVIADLRRNIFKHILSLYPSFFEQHKVGEVLSRLTADTTLLLSLISSSLSMAVRNLVMLIGGMIMLVSTSPKLALMLLIIVPVIISPLFILGKKLRVYARSNQDRVALMATHAEQVLGALKVVQAYQREQYELKKFDVLIKEQLRSAFRRILFRGALTAAIIFLAFFGVGVVLWTGGHHVLSGHLSPGDLTAFVYVAIVCAGSVAALSDVMGDCQKAVGATERIFEFLALKPEMVEPHGNQLLPKTAKGLIKFENVEFSYEKAKKNKKRMVLKNVSFEIKPGKITAIVGKSGAGKTTIFMLLERFYMINHGNITIDDMNIYDLKINEVRSIFTYVPQDPYIFATTVYENILYGNPNASKKQVLEAASQAGCDEFIAKMPYGLYTELGHQGFQLSGGQKQRIAIARAILNDPKILLLDEATSSLDSESEQLVQEALINLMRGRTTIVIAHRLSTVKHADTIIVLEEGKVAEEGTHNELIRLKSGIYSSLAKIQFNA